MRLNRKHHHVNQFACVTVALRCPECTSVPVSAYVRSVQSLSLHTGLAGDDVSCGCEIMHAFKNTFLLTDILVALTSWGFAGMSACKVMISHASSQPCSSSLFFPWETLPAGEMEGQCLYPLALKRSFSPWKCSGFLGVFLKQVT